MKTRLLNLYYSPWFSNGLTGESYQGFDIFIIAIDYVYLFIFGDQFQKNWWTYVDDHGILGDWIESLPIREYTCSVTQLAKMSTYPSGHSENLTKIDDGQFCQFNTISFLTKYGILC